MALAAMLMLPSLAPMTRWLGAQISVIVRGQPGGEAAVRDAVGGVDGHVVRALGIVNGVAATVPADAIPALRTRPGVVEVSPNLPVHMQSTGTSSWSAAADLGSLYNTTLISGAQSYWSAGYTGKGIDVAVIDSGAVPVNGLRAAGKLVFGPDLSFDSQAPNLAHLDTFGHGTHMSGIIAGRDDAAVAGHYAGDAKDFIGMAPDARIVSIKVADSHGNSDVSQVLAAIDWVVVHHADPGFNIRVVNMSFGTDSYQSYVYDPLAYAAETAWHAGVVVVGATGNRGWKTGVLDPADDPYLIAVGSSDNAGTLGTADDTVSTFSSGGDGNRNPDLVAPGAHIVSLRDPGSYVDVNNPTARVAGRFFRGSGTSMASAVVAGAAALLLSEHPLLTPDQVKNLMTSTATRLSGATSVLQGAGELNLRAALTAVPAIATQLFLPALGTGSLDGARGSARLSWGGVALQGEVDIFGLPVNTGTVARLLSAGTVWNGGLFNGVLWTGAGWATLVTGDGWTGQAWQTAAWTNNSWSNNSWSNNSWSNNSWSNNSWSNNSWSNNSWSNNSWSSAGWD
ncbi:MAG TPA: S8 family serine peptidase [Candidatus Angelobacter sp.]|nr:S8 family serine peptidase [Candidatus Angelobacter sp.]